MRRLLFDIALLAGFSAVGAVGRTLVTSETDIRHLMMALAIFASAGAASVVVGVIAPGPGKAVQAGTRRSDNAA
jgi:hypothetical protein